MSGIPPTAAGVPNGRVTSTVVNLALGGGVVGAAAGATVNAFATNPFAAVTNFGPQNQLASGSNPIQDIMIGAQTKNLKLEALRPLSKFFQDLIASLGKMFAGNSQETKPQKEKEPPPPPPPVELDSGSSE